MDDEDPNILLAIQLSLQDSAMPGGWATNQHQAAPAPAHEASLGAIGTSLPSRLEQSAQGLEVLPRSSLSSSELLELASINISAGQYSAVAVSSSQHHHHHHHHHHHQHPHPHQQQQQQQQEQHRYGGVWEGTGYNPTVALWEH